MARRPSADFRERLVTAIDAGLPPSEAATHFRVSIRTIYRWLARHRRGESLRERPRSGRPPEIAGTQRAQITALACSKAPPGHARWTLRLLADKAVELGFVESLSHTGVRAILKKTT